MKLSNTFTLFFFFVGIIINSVFAQDITLYTNAFNEEFKGYNLANQKYKFVKDNVAYHENGKWVAVKLEVPNTLTKKGNFIHLSYALLDVVELWIEDKNDELTQIYKTGQASKFSTRAHPSSDFVFPVNENTKTYYFKIYSSKPIVLPFKILSSKSLFQSLTQKNLVIGIFIGIILVMFLYNLVILSITRDKVYMYYVIYLFTLLFTQTALFGYSDRFLFQSWPIINHKFAVFTGACVGIATAFFMLNFLQLRKRTPILAKQVVVFAGLDVIGILFLFFNLDVLAFHWVNLVALYGSIIGLIAGIKLSFTGYKSAKFFLIAWTIFLISVIIFALINIGVIPYNKYLHGAMLIGSSIEAILLSIALADRINILREEKNKSQEASLKIAQENQLIIKEQNLILEEKVKLRTQELEETNLKLKATLDNLSKTHSQLAQSEKMAALGVLTAGIAHEINNPLNYILGGYTAINDELKSNELKKEDLREYLQWIKSGTERANKIVKSLNIYSRSNNEDTEDCDINLIVEDCLSILYHKTKEHIKIVQNLSDRIGIVTGNSGKLHQVLLNLIANAIDSIKNKGIISIATYQTNKQITITIEDNGHGISKANLDKIQDPFFTTKSPGKGTGLGLSISQAIIKEHHGQINFESEINKGTKVTLSLPVK